MTDRLGTAQWEEHALVSQRYPFQQGKFWLGRAEDGTPLGYRDDRHICLVSGTRAGKGTSIIINNLCFWPGSAVVVDPKGENATVTAARRGNGSEHCEGMGQAVHVLDPFKAAQVDESYRSTFNPLDALDPDHDESIDEASRLANAIVVVKDDSHDPFWDESARTMLRGLILHVLTARQFTGIRNLITVRNLIQRGAWEIAEALAEAGKEQIDPPHLLLWRSMELNQAFDGTVAGTGSRFHAMMVSSPKTFEGVLQAVILHTEFLDSPGMRRVLSKSDFKLSELKTRPEGMTLYLSLPQRYMDTHYRWLRMMVALTTTEMEITRGQPATGHRVLMVLDEFAGLKRMTAIENAVAQIAGFGVKLFFVLQSLEQLKHTYKDNWETFLANAGLKVFFNVEDHFTREYVSKLIGQTEIVRKLHSVTESRSNTEGYSEGRTESLSITQSTTTGTSVSQSTSTNESDGWNQGESFGLSYQKGLFFRRNQTFSEGNNTTASRSHGSSRGETFGQTFSNTEGNSKSTGTSQTFSRSSSTSAGTGTNESIHLRLLIQPDEVGRVFTRIDDKQNPDYPGLALVLVTGANPLVVFRKNYFEDVQFIDCFSAHPDHQWRPAISHSVDGIRPLIATLEAATNGRHLAITRWFIERGKIVSPGQAAASIEGIPPDHRTVRILVPYLGKVAAISGERALSSGEDQALDGPLFVVRSYQENTDIDPLRELREACRALESAPKPKLPAPAKSPIPRRAVLIAAAVLLVIFSAVVVGMVIANNRREASTASSIYYPSQPASSSPPSQPIPTPSPQAPLRHAETRPGPAVQSSEASEAPPIQPQYRQSDVPESLSRPVGLDQPPASSLTDKQRPDVATLLSEAQADVSRNDLAKASELYLEAAERGSKEGIFATCGYYSSLAFFGHSSLGSGTSADADPVAAKWCKKAAELGNGPMMVQLGRMYQVGIGVPKDTQEAIHWYKAAIATGDPGAVEQGQAQLQLLGAQ